MILVTGGAGYIGSVTVELLRSRGEAVVVLDNLSRGHRAAVPPGVAFYEGDVGDRKLLEDIAREHRIDACVHFAAFAYVGESVLEPARYFENNVEQGIALLDGLLKMGAPRVIFSSSCAVYGEHQTSVSEKVLKEPISPYGWSKLFMERILESYDRAYGLRYVALRFFNAAGAFGSFGERHDPETHLIPNVVSAALGQLPAVQVFGNGYDTPDGTPIRDFIHVSDLAAAHVLALDYLRAGGKSELINLGSEKGYSVLEVIETTRQVTGRPIEIKFEPPRPGDPSRHVADAEKARTLLGWKPAYTDLASIIRSEWEWRTAPPQGLAR